MILLFLLAVNTIGGFILLSLSQKCMIQGAQAGNDMYHRDDRGESETRPVLLVRS